MSNLKVKRLTLAGQSTAFTFDVPGLKFLVKNMSENNCLVNFDNITSENESTSILIPKQIAQIVLTNEYNPSGATTLYVKGTGDVEVQIVLY